MNSFHWSPPCHVIRTFLVLLVFRIITISASKIDDVINIVWLAPRNTVDDGVWATFNASSSLAGLGLALDRVQREGVMQGMKLNVTWLDSDCYAKASIGAVASVLRDLDNLPDLILGPPCSEAMQPVADMGSYLNIPVFGWMSNDHSLDNKSRESTLVRVMPPLSDLGQLLLSICYRFNWRRLALISSQGPTTSAVAEFFVQLLQESADNFYLVRHYSNVDRVGNDSSIIRRLTRLTEEARIIFLIIPETEVRRYLLHAHDLGMTNGEYQFLYVRPYISDDDEVDRMTSKAAWTRYDGRDEDARIAFRSLLIVTYSFILRWDVNYTTAETVTKELFASYSNEMPPYAQPDRYSRFLHDSFYLFCLAYNYTLNNSMNASGEVIFSVVSDLMFKGLTGDVHMNHNADRLPSFIIWDLGPGDIFRVVTEVKYGDLPNDTIFVNFIEVADIYWGNGQTWWGGYVPPDIPFCGFNGEGCPEDHSQTIILSSVLCTAFLAAVIIAFFVYRWWKKEQSLYRKTWRVQWTDISLVQTGTVRSQGHGGSQESSDHGSSINSFNRLRSNNDKGKNRSKVMDKTKSKEKAKNKSKASDKEKDQALGDWCSYSANLSVNASCSMNSSFSFADSQRHFCQTAYIRGNLVSVRMVLRGNIKLDRALLEDLHQLNTIRHANLALFFGACVDPPNACVLWEYCAKGSVWDIIQNHDVRLDSTFQFSIAMDITAGLQFIHSSELKVHGNLRSTNCLVDNRWTCKLCGFGLRNLVRGEQPLDTDENTKFTKLFWTAPENLRRVLRGEHRHLSQASDIYSLALVLKEILCKNTPYEEEVHVLGMTPKEVIMKVAEEDTVSEAYFRPLIGDLPGEHQTVMVSLVHLIQGCWADDPILRPTARRVLRIMKRLNPLKTTGIMDNMLKMMEKYSSRLEEVVAERTAQLAEEKKKTDSLLYRMLPRKVADNLKTGQIVQAELFPSVTVYFSDIVGFTQLASESNPMQIIELLNTLYTMFDDVIQEFDVYKVETIGDAYMVVSGLPEGNGERHATIMADMTLTLLRNVINFTIPHKPGKQLQVRIGLNTGPVVAGVVGNIMPRYCLFGDTVNLASRMESHGLPLKIQMSHYTYMALENKSSYVIRLRGEIEVKGKGLMKTYWLEGKVNNDDEDKETRKTSAINLLSLSSEDMKNPLSSASASTVPGISEHAASEPEVAASEEAEINSELDVNSKEASTGDSIPPQVNSMQVGEAVILH